MCLTHVRILFMYWSHDIITRAQVMTYILKNISLNHKIFIIGKGRSWCNYYFLILSTCFSTLSTWSCHYLAGIRQVIPSFQDPFTPLSHCLLLVPFQNSSCFNSKVVHNIDCSMNAPPKWRCKIRLSVLSSVIFHPLSNHVSRITHIEVLCSGKRKYFISPPSEH